MAACMACAALRVQQLSFGRVSQQRRGSAALQAAHRQLTAGMACACRLHSVAGDIPECVHAACNRLQQDGVTGMMAVARQSGIANAHTPGRSDPHREHTLSLESRVTWSGGVCLCGANANGHNQRQQEAQQRLTQNKHMRGQQRQEAQAPHAYEHPTTYAACACACAFMAVSISKRDEMLTRVSSSPKKCDGQAATLTPCMELTWTRYKRGFQSAPGKHTGLLGVCLP
eukprot:351579-Chlamydomonas_euryale.AAC.9